MLDFQLFRSVLKAKGKKGEIVRVDTCTFENICKDSNLGEYGDSKAYQDSSSFRRRLFRAFRRFSISAQTLAQVRRGRHYYNPCLLLLIS